MYICINLHFPYLFFTSVSSFKENLFDFFPWDLPVVKISPEWLRAQCRVSPVVGLQPLASGPACLGMAFPPRDARRITAAEMKYTRRRAGYTWTDYKTNTQITKELKITPILDKLLEYKRNWIQRVNRMPRNRVPRVMKHYSPTGRRNYGRPLKRLLDTWDRNGSTSDPTPRQIYDDDDDDDDADKSKA